MKRRIYAKKSLGQHYLRDENIKNRIIKSLDLNQDDTVVEIGCGRGALTDLIIEKVLKFYGIELDENLFMNLREKYKNENVEMINQDARLVNISELIKNNNSYKFVGNLPYNHANKIIMNFLQNDFQPEIMIVMIQLEVAQRIAGIPKFRGYLSAIIDTYSESKILFKVNSKSFYPEPKVASAVIQLIPRKSPLINKSDIHDFFNFIANSFVSRRKTILNSLSMGNKISKEIISKILQDVGIESNLRPQNLNTVDWIKIFYPISNFIKKNER